MSEFRIFIQTLLKRANINTEYRELFTDPEGMELFTEAFTHPSVDTKNYEIWEFIGDGIIKAILSQYIPRRYPQLRTGEGILSKARRSLESDKTLSQLGITLGFWEFVRADEDTRSRNRNKTVEDVFEAFVGVLAEIVDRRIKQSMGYIYAYNFVQSVLDEKTFTFTAETLDDPITRLNELYKARELEGGKRPLRWGDAKYQDVHLYLPIYQELPEVQQVPIGSMVIKGTVVYVATNEGWTHISNAPLLQVSALAIPGFDNMDDDQKANVAKKVWHTSVSGYNPIWPSEDGYWQEPSFSRDRDNYRIIMGQGVAFKTKDAKKMAASQALKSLQSQGFKKMKVEKKNINR